MTGILQVVFNLGLVVQQLFKITNRPRFKVIATAAPLQYFTLMTDNNPPFISPSSHSTRSLPTLGLLTPPQFLKALGSRAHIRKGELAAPSLHIQGEYQNHVG